MLQGVPNWLNAFVPAKGWQNMSHWSALREARTLIKSVLGPSLALLTKTVCKNSKWCKRDSNQHPLHGSQSCFLLIYPASCWKQCYSDESVSTQNQCTAAVCNGRGRVHIFRAENRDSQLCATIHKHLIKKKGNYNSLSLISLRPEEDAAESFSDEKSGPLLDTLLTETGTSVDDQENEGSLKLSRRRGPQRRLRECALQRNLR